MAARGERVDGTLVAWNDPRGFGFVAPDGGGRDAFVHISDFADRMSRPRVGERLTFTPEFSPDGKPRAALVVTEGKAIPQRTRGERMSRHRIRFGYISVAAFAVLYLLVATLWGLPLWVHVLYLGSSVVSFIVYAVDKSAAAAGRWRTSESTLLAFGLIGGWPGGVVAQRTLHHKSRKRSFQAAFWGTVALNVIAFIVFASVSERVLGG